MKHSSPLFTKIAVACVATFALMSSATAEPVKEIRLLEMGGVAGDMVQAAYIDPFQRKSGVKVLRENPASLGKIKAMVASGNITMQAMLLTDGWLAQAKAENLLEPLDWSVIDPKPIRAGARDPYAIGWSYASGVMAWRKEVKPLNSWADFWNVKDFPGKRTLPDNPSIAIPVALIADGVPIDKLYPLDLDRAFASLRKIRPSISVWWTSAGQSAQLLEDKEVVYGMTYNGRVFDKPDVAYTYKQGYLELSWFGVPKGISPEQKTAVMKFFHELTEPDNQVVAMQRLPYAGSSLELDKLIPAEKQSAYPTTAGNANLQFVANAQEWQKVAPVVEKRWQQFKLGM